MGDLLDQLILVGRTIGEFAAEKLIHHHTQRVDVGLLSQRLVAQLLRGHIAWGADGIHDLRNVGVNQQRGTEVTDSYIASTGGKQVSWFDIPMDQPKR